MLPGAKRNILPLCLIPIKISLKGLLSRSYDNRALSKGLLEFDLLMGGWVGSFLGWELSVKMTGAGLGGIDRGAEGGRSSRRMRECEANHPEERSVNG